MIGVVAAVLVVGSLWTLACLCLAVRIEIVTYEDAVRELHRKGW